MRNPPPNSGGGWHFLPYVNPSGRSPVLDFLAELQEKHVKKRLQFDVLRQNLEAAGPFAVGGTYWEAVGDELYEMSWGRCRIYCCLSKVSRKRVMMLLGVIKLWPKFRPGDRNLCLQYKADIESAAYDQEHRELLYQAHCQRRARGSA